MGLISEMNESESKIKEIEARIERENNEEQRNNIEKIEIKSVEQLIEKKLELNNEVVEQRIEQSKSDKIKGEIIWDLMHVPAAHDQCSSIISDYNMALLYLYGYKLETLADIFHLSYSTIRNTIAGKLGLKQFDRNGTFDNKVAKLFEIKCKDINQKLTNNEVIDKITSINTVMEDRMKAIEYKLVKIEVILEKLMPILEKGVLLMKVNSYGSNK